MFPYSKINLSEASESSNDYIRSTDLPPNSALFKKKSSSGGTGGSGVNLGDDDSDYR